MNPQSCSRLPPSTIRYMIDHMFLPPKLPQKDDSSPDRERALVTITIDALEQFGDLVKEDQNGAVASVVSMVSAMRNTIDSDGTIDESKLFAVLNNLPEKGGTILLHICAQNAGLMISHTDSLVHVEAFEVCALNESVISTKGRLCRSFPGIAVGISTIAFNHPDLQATMAHTLAKMSYQPAMDTRPKARKAGQIHDENRDTTHPKMVTELFMGFLGPMSAPVDVCRISKNTREEVLWSDAFLPWRRSPLWMLLRVAMQLTFSRMAGKGERSSGHYKVFMIFLLAKVLDLSLSCNLPCELLYAMNAKLGRRLLKLNLSSSEAEIAVVQRIMRQTALHIQSRWENVMRDSPRPHGLTALEGLDFKHDAMTTLGELNGFLDSLAKTQHVPRETSFHATSTLARSQDDDLPSLPDNSNEYFWYNLKVFESWIALSLPRWFERHCGEIDTCRKLANLILTYFRTTSSLYSGNPEEFSILLLNIVDLWVACDRSALQQCSFLRDYDPGFPHEVLQGLILPLECQMQRLLRAEEHLKHRRECALYPSPSLFKDFGQSFCFAVRYFNQSHDHQRMRDNIITRATNDREAKVRELREKQDHYRDLMQLHDQSSCEYYEAIVNRRNNVREQRHSAYCRRCNYKLRASRIDITIHEWPLPRSDLEAKSTVFELSVPSFYGHWRDTALFLLVEVFRTNSPSARTPQAYHPLRTYRGLSCFFVPYSSQQRLILLSENKPHGVTHRRNKTIVVTTESDVCLNNGLRYHYYDDTSGTFIHDFPPNDQVSSLLTYQLPDSSSDIQQYLCRPFTTPCGPPPNTVLANQSDCPSHMSLDEYKALCSIPLGYHIQWHNILVQLAMPSVDFKKVETVLVTLQSIYQAGPPQDGTLHRASHEVLKDPVFAFALLRCLEESLQRIQDNWESAKAVTTFSSVAARLLSLNSVADIQAGCLKFTREIRAVTFGWATLLTDRARGFNHDSRRAELLSHAAELSLICTDTFNFDDKYLSDELNTSEYGSIFIQCCIFIQGRTTALSCSSDPMIPILLQRWKTLCYRVYPTIARQVLTLANPCLDDAMKKAWSSYEIGYGWHPVPDEYSCWLENTLSLSCSDRHVVVHYNLLTGELLVDGFPLARLPRNYTEHPMYQTLFGSTDLEIVPSPLPGMQFSAKRNHAGYSVHLNIEPSLTTDHYAGNDLMVRAVKGKQSLFLVPSRVLKDQFPFHFTTKFVHWYDPKSDCVEFRPVDSPWTSSANNWKLFRVSGGGQWRLLNGGHFLFSLASDTTRVISTLLSAMDDPSHIHTILQHSSSSLEIELPRLSLGFSLKIGTSQLQSKQFRGLTIDSNQTLGTLVGLHSKLLLKNMDTGARMVIIPEGILAWQKTSDHVHASIDRNTMIKYHAYPVEDRLGRLLDNGTLQSKLWLCYLHAVTSFCFVDPLTHHTGTEQALTILSSAAIRSFHPLDQENIDLMERIAQLTPGREYYPLEERVMQTVKWVPKLSFLAQHGGFYKNVQIILDQVKKMMVFNTGSTIKLPTLSHVTADLLHRDRIRSSTFRISGFGAEDHTVEHDTTYPARDQGQNTSQALDVFFMSAFAFHGFQTVPNQFSACWSTRAWSFLTRQPVVFGPDVELPPLRYDAGLLHDWAEIVAQHWCALHRALSRQRPRYNKFEVMIWLSTIAFAKVCEIEILQAVGAFFSLSQLADVSPPAIHSFRLSEGSEVCDQELHASLKTALRPFAEPSVSWLVHGPEELQRTERIRQQRQFGINQTRSVDRFVKTMVAQWPCAIPVPPEDVEFNTYMDITEAMQVTRTKFNTWYANYQLKRYLDVTGDLFRSVAAVSITIPSRIRASPVTTANRGPAFISADDVFSIGPSHLLVSEIDDLTEDCVVSTDATSEQSRLPSLLKKLEVLAEPGFEMDYVEDLRRSLAALHNGKRQYRLAKGKGIRRILSTQTGRCIDHLEHIYGTMTLDATVNDTETGGRSLARRFQRDILIMLSDIGLCPRQCPLFFLQQLCRHRWVKITHDWKLRVVQYARALSGVQRMERLTNLCHSEVDLIKEMLNRGHKNWDPVEYPESLLLEVESGILIREVQAEIAAEMRNVTKNATMQLNMGEGKSSTIIPSVAAALANGTRLVRVITAKPQAKQMFQMLVSKLGGLLDRQIYHMPFSRSVRVGSSESIMIGLMCRECMARGGVMLVQPEHILSFKLMGLECLINGKEAIGRALIDVQEFLDVSSRDIVDESDENFSVKFELVYTMGLQRPIELSPQRWTCIQRICGLVKKFAVELAQEAPTSMEIHAGPKGSFPYTRILDDLGQRQLITRIAKSICEDGIADWPISRQPSFIRKAVFRYLTENSPLPADISSVESRGPGSFWTDSTSQMLLLLRGLFAGGIISFALRQKRWRVQYGIDPRRRPPTKLAVPYRAKDSPEPRSEFSHPDVVILLTCLSHYYSGLDDEDMFLAFDHLLKSFQADIEYQEWMKDAPDLPVSFRQLSGINLKDRFQCIEQIFPSLHHAKNVVDYFLAHIVFPKAMREFPHKLSASGWDIGQIKRLPTSGFSGTSDSRITLPLGMSHLDLSEQKHTNALVLEYLLQPENYFLPISTTKKMEKSMSQSLLDMVTEIDPPVQVILDVGAQILELSNYEVAREWLTRTTKGHNAQAVIFFDEDDELSVLDRKGRVESLQSSPLADQLDVCLVFLDEAHTRGTDLRLPHYYKAAVTLGANLTKDRLIQACMRMRKLGHGQSLVFCVPEEICRKLLPAKMASQSEHIGVPEVLCWTITETWADIQRNMSLWVGQGRRFERQKQLWADARTNGQLMISKALAENFLEDEAQSLEARYRPVCSAITPNPTSFTNNPRLQRITDRLREFRILDQHSAPLQEEQERELSPEIVQEREVENPVAMEPAVHKIHPDVQLFVIYGKINNSSDAFKPVFETLRRTSAASCIDITQFPKDILTTSDFARTIQFSGRGSLLDAYQRSVQWVLTSIGDTGNNTAENMVIISPFEAEALYATIQNSKRVTLHLYAPRTNLGIRPLDGLDLYRVTAMSMPPILPSLFVTQLNLFAGQLYMESFEAYVELCDLLGLAWQKAGTGDIVAADGFIIQDRPYPTPSLSRFRESPVPFFRVLMTKIRKNCEEIDKTHVGAVLSGRLLAPSEFEATRVIGTGETM